MNFTARINLLSIVTISIAALFLAGCGLVGGTATATRAAATAAPTETALAATVLAPTETAPAATPTSPAEAAALPAPLYFISSSDSQLWRVERDGITLT